jgi:hypothetical protein
MIHNVLKQGGIKLNPGDSRRQLLRRRGGQTPSSSHRVHGKVLMELM